MNPSDRKKMLSLPIFLSKRSEDPTPKKGQPQYDLFEKIYGRPYDKYDNLKRDEEKKITEFDFEEFIHPELLKDVDTTTDEFKQTVRRMNFDARTQYEQHCEDQENFRKLMPLLANLNAAEMDALVHKMKNEATTSEAILESVTSNEYEKRMAQISEEENFNKKNWYRHEQRTLRWADKQRMKVDAHKVRDMLRNQNIVKHDILNNYNTYYDMESNLNTEHGVLQYVNDCAYGDMRELLNDVGIKRDTIPFMNLANLNRMKEGNDIFDSDDQYPNLTGSMFLPVDGTDHEESFIGWNEFPRNVPLSGYMSWLECMKDEPWPQTDKSVGINAVETFYRTGTSPSYQAIIQDRFADKEEEEIDDEYGAQGDDDDYGDDYGEEGEDEEGGEEDYGDYGEEEEDPNAPIDDLPRTSMGADRFFLGMGGVKDKYSTNEVDAFMRLL